VKVQSGVWLHPPLAKAACPAASREPRRLGQFQLLLNQGKDLGTGKLKEIKDEEKRGTIPLIVSQTNDLDLDLQGVLRLWETALSDVRTGLKYGTYFPASLPSPVH
jgi:hypothetical protein